MLKNDLDLDVFGKSIYRNRVLEDMQYCPLCEETALSNLFVVHLVKSANCTEGDIQTKDNGLILCREHAEAFLNNENSFDESGFVCKCKTNAVNNKMHLSFSIRSSGRRKYLKWLSDMNY